MLSWLARSVASCKQWMTQRRTGVPKKRVCSAETTDSSADDRSHAAQEAGSGLGPADATTPLRAAASVASTGGVCLLTQSTGEPPSPELQSGSQTPAQERFPRGQKLARTPPLGPSAQAAASKRFELQPAGSSAELLPTPPPIRDRGRQQRQQHPAPSPERGALQDITPREGAANRGAAAAAAAADSGKTPGASSCKTPGVEVGAGLATPGEAPPTQPLRRYMVDSGKVVGVANTVARYHPTKRLTARTTPFNVRVQRELEIEEQLLVPSPPPSPKQQQGQAQQQAQRLEPLAQLPA